MLALAVRKLVAFFSQEPRRLLSILILAFVVRLCFHLVYGGLGAPLVRWGDDHHYHWIARGLAMEGRYENTWFPPGYPFFLAGLYALFGPHLAVVRLAQIVLGTLACLFTYRVARRLHGDGVGTLAGLLLALYPGHVYIGWRIMAETLFITLLVLAVDMTLGLLSRPRIGRGLLIGGVLGCAGAVKSNLVVFPYALLAWLAWCLLVRRPRHFRVLAAVALAFFAAVALTPAANRLAGGVGSLVAGNAGHTFWMANNPVADGYFVSGSLRHPEASAFAEAHGLGHVMEIEDPFEKDRAFRRLGMLWIREHPGPFMVLCGKKLLNAFGPLPRAAVFEKNRLARWMHVSSYGLLSPFMALGLVLALRRVRQSMLLLLPLASYAAMVVLFYGTPRFTILVIPYLLILAAVGLDAVRVFATSR